MLTDNTCFIEVAFQSILNKMFKFLAAGLLANTNLNLNLGWRDTLCQLQEVKVVSLIIYLAFWLKKYLSLFIVWENPLWTASYSLS